MSSKQYQSWYLPSSTHHPSIDILTDYFDIVIVLK